MRAQTAAVKGIHLELCDIEWAITGSTPHLNEDRSNSLAAPTLKRALGDYPVFDQLGLNQEIDFSLDESLNDATKLQQLRIPQLIAKI